MLFFTDQSHNKQHYPCSAQYNNLVDHSDRVRAPLYHILHSHLPHIYTRAHRPIMIAMIIMIIMMTIMIWCELEPTQCPQPLSIYTHIYIYISVHVLCGICSQCTCDHGMSWFAPAPSQRILLVQPMWISGIGCVCSERAQHVYASCGTHHGWYMKCRYVSSYLTADAHVSARTHTSTLCPYAHQHIYIYI